MRFAILSDIHANFQALSSVHADVTARRQHEEENGFPRTQYWFLGDIVGYGPDPARCINWLRTTARIGDRWVPGNHDEYLQTGYIPDGENIHPDAKQTLEYHRQTLEEPIHDRERNWFYKVMSEALQDYSRGLVIEEHGDLTVLFTHAATPPSMRRSHYIFPWVMEDLVTEIDHLNRTIKENGTVLLFCGHTHYPMWVKAGESGLPELLSIKYSHPMQLGDGLMIINPGSVGQPRDGDPRASYIILDIEEKTVEFRRIEYKIEETVSAIWSMLGVDDEVKSALVGRIKTANGGAQLQQFNTIYRRPHWDLEAIYEWES